MNTIFIHGTKHTCTSCANRFYDLAKSPATCPICGKVVSAIVKAPARSKRRVPDSNIDHEKDAQAAHTVVVLEPKFKHVKWR